MAGRTFSPRRSDTPLYGVRNVLTSFDLQPNKPDVAIQLIKKYSDQYRDTAGMDLTLLGADIPVASEIHTAFMEGRFWNTVTVSDQAESPAQNIEQELTCALDQGAFFPKVSQQILYPGNARIRGIITNVDFTVPTAPVVTVTPLDGGTLPLVPAGTELVVIDSAFGEGTNQPDSSAPSFGRLDYYLQIIKDKYGITGSQLTNKQEFEVFEDGKSAGVWNVGVTDLESRVLRAQEMMMFLGSGGLYNHANLVGAGLVNDTDFVQTSRGLVEWAELWGGVDNTVDNTNWDITNLDDVDDYLKSEGDVSPIVIGYVGGVIGRRMNSQLGSLTSVQASYDPTSALSEYLGGKNYDAASVKARAVNLRFLEFKNFNRTYAFREVPSFSDTKGLGADGYNYNQYTSWFPLANVRDAKSGAKMPLASMLYKEKDGYNRKLEAWQIKGAGGDTANYNTENDSLTVNMRSNCGFAMHKPNLIYMTTPA